MADLREWLSAQLARISPKHDVAKAINYMLCRWHAFIRFLDDGRGLPFQQRRRTVAALRDPRAQVMAILRLRPRW